VKRSGRETGFRTVSSRISPRNLERSTAGSISELTEERGWVRRSGGVHETTTAGSLVVGRFVPLLETVEALRTLGEGIAHLPVETMDLDVRHFHDADLVTPMEFDPAAAFEYGIERLRISETLRSVGQIVPPPYVRSIHEQALAGDLEAEIVLDPTYVDAL